MTAKMIHLSRAMAGSKHVKYTLSSYFCTQNNSVCFFFKGYSSTFCSPCTNYFEL